VQKAHTSLSCFSEQKWPSLGYCARCAGACLCICTNMAPDKAMPGTTPHRRLRSRGHGSLFKRWCRSLYIEQSQVLVWRCVHGTHRQHTPAATGPTLLTHWRARPVYLVAARRLLAGQWVRCTRQGATAVGAMYTSRGDASAPHYMCTAGRNAARTQRPTPCVPPER
jgi:hypothetical protein